MKTLAAIKSVFDTQSEVKLSSIDHNVLTVTTKDGFTSKISVDCDGFIELAVSGNGQSITAEFYVGSEQINDVDPAIATMIAQQAYFYMTA